MGGGGWCQQIRIIHHTHRTPHTAHRIHRTPYIYTHSCVGVSIFLQRAYTSNRASYLAIVALEVAFAITVVIASGCSRGRVRRGVSFFLVGGVDVVDSPAVYVHLPAHDRASARATSPSDTLFTTR